MREIKDGGPAFPGIEGPGGGYAGMTLRDYFAAAALSMMHGVVLTAIAQGTDELNNGIAKAAYEVADAMLKAREAK